ncbi:MULTISPECIES: ABC transporter substrate-binding protein [Streptomyces]|uniref:ABC transporter substrate-binding protein n=1 Tax=Streptomyces TaxID=1883 RepID=UPI002057513C|nr:MULTISPECIES: ABC transporter substrate-binding protein [Streptomyces]UPT40256.1 ABC transporter substrate-binding protein [Streptomyces sp. WAC00303]WIY74542.1 ABC transporter substrate-binding protein [Streptomyces anulatus]
MTEQSEWRFSDDRGQRSTASRTPERVLAYVQAGATLWDLGIRPVGIFGSDHDGPDPDTAKTGTLPLGEVAYVGAGAALDVERLLSAGPDLVVAVSYGGGHVYGLTPETAKPLEERVPVVVLDVSQARTFGEIGDRFAALARSLGATARPGADRDLAAARERLRSVVAATSGDAPRVLALSPAGQDQAHVARPRMWPELRVLTELGVQVVEPAEGSGANWSTQSRSDTFALRPEVILTDIRAHAAPLEELRGSEGAPTPVVPWNPEPLYGPRDHARFLGLVADALEAARAS